MIHPITILARGRVPPLDCHPPGMMGAMSSRATPPRTRSTAIRRVLFGALAGAVVGLLLAVLAGWQPLPGTGHGDQPSAEAFTAPPGSCLDWTSPNAADARRVDCGQRHVFEVTGPASLAGNFAPGIPFPDDATWRGLVQARCAPLTVRYLSGRFDPFGLYSVGALKPSRPGWQSGARELRCGLQVTGPSGALYPVVGSASDHDQSAVHAPGTCLGIDGKAAGDPVDCSAPHGYEVVGTVNLGVPFPNGYPDPGKQDDYLGQTCAKVTAEYAGGADATTKKGLVGAWDDRKQESWAAGSEQVNCLVGAKLPDALGPGLAPVTGSVKGQVTVGRTVAPSMSPPAPPGAPVPNATPITPPLSHPSTPPSTGP